MPTLQLDKQTIQKMQAYYEKALTTPVAYSVFVAKLPHVTITAYNSGKVLFQGKDADNEASIWGNSAPTRTKTSSADLPDGFAKWSVIGSDEVGTGSYFGSLTVCAAYVPQHLIATVTQLGVKDSKNLTDVTIQKLAKQLKELIPFHLLDVLPEKYNDIQPTRSQGQIKAELHNFAIAKLLKKIAPETPQAILIDQFELPSTYYRHIAKQPTQIKESVYFATKGESHHIAVAAASIIARAAFLDTLADLSKEIGIDLPSGANAHVDQVAASIIKEHGMHALKKVAKLHFANTQKAQALAEKI